MSAQPIWDDAWAAWVVRDPERPDAWLIWSDDSSSWKPLPVVQEPTPVGERTDPRADEPEPLPVPVAARLHANGPLRDDDPFDDSPRLLAAEQAGPGRRRSTYEAPPADDGTGGDAPPQPAQQEAPVRAQQSVDRPEPHVGVPVAAAGAQTGSAAHPVPAPGPPNIGPFVAPSASQVIAVPAARASGGGTAVLALGIAAIGVGVLVMLIGLASSSLLAVGVGDPGAVRAAVNLLAVLAFPIAVLGVVLGALQLRSRSVPHRDRALIGFGICSTVALLLAARGVTALVNTVLLGYPLL